MRTTNKDMLLGLVGTLTDKECGEIYFLITGVKQGLDVIKGKVTLTQGQYDKLIWLWGKDKTDKCIEILNEWLESKGDKITKKISHYRQLIGWVETKYHQLYPVKYDKSLRFDSKIDTAWKAKKYIKGIPPELRAYDTEVKYLVDRYGKDILP